MKKTLILVAAMLLIASVAFGASILNSKHDMSSQGGQTVRGNLGEICVYCHTPHAASASVSAPLWNRSADGSSAWTNTAYTSSTMNGTSSAPDSANGVSAACLSCHDGNLADETLVNGPGSGAGTQSVSQTGTFSAWANLNDGTTGLSNDHPIGINMAAVSTPDSGIRVAPLNSNVRLFSGLVECGSCHKVHDNAIPPFLAMSNSASAMCLTCHNK